MWVGLYILGEFFEEEGVSFEIVGDIFDFLIGEWFLGFVVIGYFKKIHRSVC